MVDPGAGVVVRDEIRKQWPDVVFGMQRMAVNQWESLALDVIWRFPMWKSTISTVDQ